MLISPLRPTPRWISFASYPLYLNQVKVYLLFAIYTAVPLIPTRGNIWAFLALEAMYYVYVVFGRSIVMERSLPLCDGSACTACINIHLFSLLLKKLKVSRTQLDYLAITFTLSGMVYIWDSIYYRIVQSSYSLEGSSDGWFPAWLMHMYTWGLLSLLQNDWVNFRLLSSQSWYIPHPLHLWSVMTFIHKIWYCASHSITNSVLLLSQCTAKENLVDSNNTQRWFNWWWVHSQVK